MNARASFVKRIFILSVPAMLLAVGVCDTQATSSQAARQAAPRIRQGGEPLIHSVKGPDLFRAYCASCHGLSGKGDGPAAPALKAKVPDLTLIAKKNGGQFPAAAVRRMIDGYDFMISHGSREMPIWGPIFHEIEEDQDWGNVRLENLVKYLISIQQE